MDLQSKHGRDEKSIEKFSSVNWKGRGYSEDLWVDGSIILEWALGK
jgi:hypothetical protein